MITEYELYADERETQGRSGHWFWLGGVVCTDKGRARLLGGLSDVRARYGLSREMKWRKVSQRHLDAYRAWVDVFFDDPSARFSLLQIDLSSREWASFRPRPDRPPSRDDRLASAYHQFLLVTFRPLHDTKRWWVYPDAGLFSRDTVLDRVEFLFNRTYKHAFGPKSSRTIRLARTRDSAKTDLVQLADVLLGALSWNALGARPESSPRAQLVDQCAGRLAMKPATLRGLRRVSLNRWMPPDDYSYDRQA
jgi:hypothetical protein